MTKKNLTDKQKVTAHSALLKEVGRKYLQVQNVCDPDDYQCRKSSLLFAIAELLLLDLEEDDKKD